MALALIDKRAGESCAEDFKLFRLTTIAEPNPEAHADVLVSGYGLQHASWIAESNVTTARPSDRDYWSRVLVRLQQTAHSRPRAARRM